jgi:hypothetical protein
MLLQKVLQKLANTVIAWGGAKGYISVIMASGTAEFK